MIKKVTGYIIECDICGEIFNSPAVFKTKKDVLHQLSCPLGEEPWKIVEKDIFCPSCYQDLPHNFWCMEEVT